MNNAFELLIGSLGAIACWALWFYFAKEQRVDSFREELFAIRKDLFLLAASGEVSFESKSYTELRYLINGMLRFAHRISLPASLVAARLAEINPDKSNIYDKWKRSLDGVPADVRPKLDSIHSRMFRAYMNHLVHGSVILSVVAFAFIAQAAMRAVALSLFTEKNRADFDLVDIAVNNIANSFHAQALEEQAYRDQSDQNNLQLA